MSDSQVGLGAARMALLASVAFACGSGSAAGDPAGGAHLLVLPGLSAGQPLKAETVRFADPRHRSVQVMRGAPRPEAAPPGVEFLGFGSTGAQQVRVVRGPVVSLDLPGLRRVETVSFSEAGRSSVTVVRGGLEPQLVAGLFRAAGGRTPERGFSVDLFQTSGGDLDRIAFAVDGVESNHGQNPLMWRPTPDGPQGPMQVSLKAALDVGGGNSSATAIGRMRSLPTIGGRAISRPGSPPAGRPSGCRARRPVMSGGCCVMRWSLARTAGEALPLAGMKQHRAAERGRQIERDRLICGR